MSWERELSPDERRRIFTTGDVYRIGVDEQRRAKRPLRIAVLGAGGVAQAKHLPALTELAGRWEPVSLCAVMTRDSAQSSKLSAVWHVPVYSDAAKLLREQAPDAVIITAPDEHHHELAIAALDAGADVLVEKPLSTSVESAQAMSQHAVDRGRLLMTVTNKRFSPPYRAAHRWLEEERIGAPSSLTARFALGYDYVDLLSQGTIHVLDLLRWFGGDVETVHALRATGTTRCHLAVALRFASGAVGTLSTTDGALSLHPWERLEVFSDGPWFEVNDQSEATLHPGEELPAERWDAVIPNTLVSGLEWGGYVGLLEEWLDALRGTPPVVTNPTDGVRAVELASAIGASAESGEAIVVGQ